MSSLSPGIYFKMGTLLHITFLFVPLIFDVKLPHALLSPVFTVLPYGPIEISKCGCLGVCTLILVILKQGCGLTGLCLRVNGCIIPFRFPCTY